MNFAKFIIFLLPSRCARDPKGHTLARQKVIFPTYMPPEKYWILSFSADCPWLEGGRIGK